MAAGKPIVTTKLPSLLKYSNLIYISNTHKQFIENIRKCVAEDNYKNFEKRISVAKLNSWDEKIRKIEEALNSVLNENIN